MTAPTLTKAERELCMRYAAALDRAMYPADLMPISSAFYEANAISPYAKCGDVMGTIYVAHVHRTAGESSPAATDRAVREALG